MALPISSPKLDDYLALPSTASSFNSFYGGKTPISMLSGFGPPKTCAPVDFDTH